MTDTPETTETPIEHKSIDAAKVAVMADVRRLQQTAENKHGKYRYTPVDEIKDFIRPLLVKHGISFGIDERKVKIIEIPSRNGTTVSLKATFDVFISHPSSDIGCRSKQTVILPYVGAQTAGIARSYALKEWLKATFLISTGEDAGEADSLAPESYGTTKELDPYTQPKAKAKFIYDALASDIRTHTNLDTLDTWWNSQTISEKFRALPSDWKRTAFIEFAVQALSIAETAAAGSAFKKQYKGTFDRLSEDELLAIEDAVQSNKQQ